MPYFITDNQERVTRILHPKSRKKTPLEIAAERHAKRTDEQKAEILRKWNNNREYLRLKANPDYVDVEYNYENGGLKATHVGHNFDEAKGWYEKSVQEIGYNNGHSVILEQENHTIINQRNVEGLFDSLSFEIAGAETGIPNNIRNALKHCASKPDCKIAVIFMPNENNIDMASIRAGLKKYFGLRGNKMQFKDFEHIYVIAPNRIIYHQKKQGD